MRAPRPRVISRTGQSLHNTLTLTTCWRCRARILACTVGGVDKHIDLTPLTATGELAALLDRRRTYNLHGDWVNLRAVHHIRSGRRDRPVLAGHTCTPAAAAGHLEPAHLDTVIALVQHLVGGVHTPLPTQPPF